MVDNSVDARLDAIQQFMGDRKITILYYDRSGEIEQAPKELHITA